MTGRLKEADERTKRELADKCQENGWLKVGGFDWQDDPFLEELSLIHISEPTRH